MIEIIQPHFDKDISENSIFSDDDLLHAYDRILPLADHYRSIMDIHLHELAGCEHIIDFGCGTGIPTIEFLKRGQRVTAVDISRKSLDILRRKAEAADCEGLLTLIHADIMDLSEIPDQSFDGASSMIVAHLLSNPAAHFYEGFRVLKPGSPSVVTSRIKGGDQEALVSSTLNSLIRSGHYAELEKDYNIITNLLLRTANGRSQSLLLADEVKTLLSSAGFVKVKTLPQRTADVMLTISVNKPEMA